MNKHACAMSHIWASVALKVFLNFREDALPEDELKESERQSSAANLVICLGTSLQITPACNLPLRCLKNGMILLSALIYSTAHAV